MHQRQLNSSTKIDWCMISEWLTPTTMPGLELSCIPLPIAIRRCECAACLVILERQCYQHCEMRACDSADTFPVFCDTRTSILCASHSCQHREGLGRA